MMTKYQLVFIKLETTMHKILANIDAKKKQRLKRGIQAFRDNVLSWKLSNIRTLNKKRLVCMRFEQHMGRMVRAIERCQTKACLAGAFGRMKMGYKGSIQEEQSK